MRVKICCIQNGEELDIAIRAGVNAIGLVGKMPNGPGPIDDSSIREIASMVPPGLSSFLLTSETAVHDIIAHHHRTLTDTIQIVDYVEPLVYSAIRAQLPALRIVQVIHVTGPESIGLAEQIASQVDAILLDSGNPGDKNKTLGGTGRTHDWKISRQIVESVDVPVYLAGGLNPENVVEAIQAVRPFGVDVCSGLRSEGKLDPVKVGAFMDAIDQIK